jgi:dolichol-phosphate mannosyltransferase
MSKICVVVPTYNEAENLPRLIDEVEKALRGFDFSLLVVDDNSPDGTAQVAADLNKIHKNLIVRTRTKKNGLGSALSYGLRTALAMKDVDRIVTLDADLSHNPSDIPKLLQAEDAGIVQGSRYVENGAVVGWSLKRRLISCVANLLCKLLLRTSIHDCTGNFRVYSRDCAETIVNSTISKGFEWVVEAMFVAKRHGFGVEEVPITFVDRKEGKTKLKAIEVAGWAAFALKSLLCAGYPA